MSPVLEAVHTPIQPTRIFGDFHAGYGPSMLATGFPPTVENVAAGIKRYRDFKGYDSADSYPFATIERMLMRQEFRVGDKRARVVNVDVIPIATPVDGYSIGDVEMHTRLLLGPTAGAVNAYQIVGTGTPDNYKQVKADGDGAATDGMHAALDDRSVNGRYRGSEGAGRDQMGRKAAVGMNEPFGLGYGLKVDAVVDAMEETNASKRGNPHGGSMGNGEGWSPEMRDPSKRYPGYSGASSLFLGMNATNDRIHPLTDDLYIDKAQASHELARHLTMNGATHLPFAPETIVNAASTVFRKHPSKLFAAALARERHMPIMRAWIDAGMEPWNLLNPSDGDAMFAFSLAAELLHFAGLTGGVMEGTISSAFGIVMGIRTWLQYVSHSQLKDRKEGSDLMNLAHRFGFSDKEYKAMFLTRLLDSKNIERTLLELRPTGLKIGHIKNDAWQFVRRGEKSENEVQEFAFKLEKIIEQKDTSVRLEKWEQRLVINAFLDMGFIDVRRTLRFSDLVPSRDWLVAAAGITDNRWAPIQGIRKDDHSLLVDLIVAGGSNAMYVLTLRVQDVT